MSTRTHPRADSRPDNTLAFVDQALFLGLRATGHAAAMQIVWVYEHPIDWDELWRFHREYGYGLAGRRIEPSILPFGRHRWVASLGPAAPLEIAQEPRARSELSDWADEQVQLPLDPEFGPGWRMAAQPMTDGSTAVTLLGSHCIGDGGGALFNAYQTVVGQRRDLNYPPPHSRTRRRALVEDLRQTVRDAPELGRTVVAAAKFLRQKRLASRTSSAAPFTSMPGSDGDEAVVVPAVAAHISLEDWDARSAALGGNSHSLLAGLASRMAVHQGRQLSVDGTVGLIVPINDRTFEDTRANAVKLAYVNVEPTQVTTDLSGTRTAIRDALKLVKEVPDEAMELLPLTPFVPKAAVRRTADLAFGFTEQPVSCSNMGDLPLEVGSPDGSPAEQVLLRGVDQHITRRVLEERHGLLTVVGGRLNGTFSMTFVGYQPGLENTKERLRERVAKALAEFELAGTIV